MKFFAVLAATMAAQAQALGEDTTTVGGYPSPISNPAPSPSYGYFLMDLPEPAAGPHPGTSTQFPPTTTTVNYVPGCTNADACNFDAQANQDDGTCSVPGENMDCNGNCLQGLEMDCTGVCGGNAVCCPATCAVVKGSAAMSCDDVAVAVGEETAESCSSLENSGCDCTGCGCGIVIDSQGYSIVDGMEDSGLTCDKGLKVSSNPQPCTSANTCSATECKQYCTDSTAGCTHAAHNTQGGCILYTSCKDTRTVASTTTTYRFVGNNIGMVEDEGEACSCSWWICVNDNDQGYCD